MRCVEGCRTCRRTYEPEPEKCDDVDNDCSGQVDEGEPSEMGDPLPAMAARLLDVGYPGAVEPRASEVAWAVFRNEGSRTWEAGEVWLEATRTWDGEPSDLYDMEGWPAYGVAAVLDCRVETGEEVMMKFPVRVEAGAKGTVRETFHLVDRAGEALKCPSVKFEVSLVVRRGMATEEEEGDEVVVEVREAEAEGGCAVSGRAGCRGRGWGGGWWWMVAGLWLVAKRRKSC